MHRRGHTENNGNGFITSSNAALRRQSLRKVEDERKKTQTASKVSDIKSLKLRGTAGSMQGFISEVSEDFQPYFNIYERENLWKQWSESNEPEVRQWSKEQFQKAGMVMKDPEEEAWWHNEPRAFHQTSRKWRNLAFGEPITRRMTIRKGSLDDFFAELSHSAQKASVWEQYKMPRLRKKYGEDVYDMPGNLEYQAHKVIQPKLEESFWTATPKSYKSPYRSEY